MLNNHYKPEGTIHLDNGGCLLLRDAGEADMQDIKALYYKVYGGKYPLPEINDSDKMKWVINDPNYLWLLYEFEGKIVSSVIFVVEPVHKIGKTFAGVVSPEFRGHKLMKKAIKFGLDYLMYKRNFCELVYGVVRTFASVGFHEDLKDLGFIDLGIFPNVRKVKKYETHGLKAVYKKETFDKRKETPRLIAPANEIYEITRKKMNLEEAFVENEYIDKRDGKKEFSGELFIEKSPEVEWEYYRQRDAGGLLFDFFPFHYPQLKLYTRDHSTEVFIHFLEVDGYATIMGIRTGEKDLVTLLSTVCEYLENMGIKYLEVLASAYDIEKQKQLYSSNFLPCAYFPAAKKETGPLRSDLLVFCRLFVPIDFHDIHFSEDTKAYARAFHKISSKKIWEDLQNA